MVLYEVNLKIKKEIHDEYLAWLLEHIDEMLQLQGFEDARLWENQDEELEWKHYTVHYLLQDEHSMNYYLKNLAPKMRQQAHDRFHGGFEAERRVFSHCPIRQEAGSALDELLPSQV